MLDLSFGELALIGAVALVVLGPERLPKVARTAGEWAGRAQRYVSQVKTDINREMELSELKRLQEQARNMAASVESQVSGTVGSLEKDFNQAAASLEQAGSELGATADTGAAALPSSDLNSAASAYSWDSEPSWERKTFARRYKSGPSVDELAEELARIKRQLAMPEAGASGNRHKYAPRARMNRPRIRR
ncbi:MAG: Sec-independent protein translocase protein TatB [Burkholderiaceae bacterium]